MDAGMLYHTPDKRRFFLVPEGAMLSEGPLRVQSFVRQHHDVGDDIFRYEIDAATAKRWVDTRFTASLAAASGAWDRLVERLRASRPLPEDKLPSMPRSAEAWLGVSAGEAYTDPKRASAALRVLLSQLSSRLRPEGATVEAERVASEVGAALRRAAAQVNVRRQASRPSMARPPRKLLRVGFFSELRHGDPQGTSLAEVWREAPGPHEAEIVAYLREAPVLIASPGVVRDVLDSDSGYVGTASIHSDGVWCWPGDLAYYVQRYHVSLPEDFLAHLVACGWTHLGRAG